VPWQIGHEGVGKRLRDFHAHVGRSGAGGVRVLGPIAAERKGTARHEPDPGAMGD